MTPESVLLLVSSVVLIGFAVLILATSAALYWSIRQFLPIHAFHARLSLIQAEQQSLSAQVTKLRTSKAGTRSSEKKKQAAEDDDENPLFDGLTQEDRALFQ